MLKFKGFELVRVLRAVTAGSPDAETDETHKYEIEVHGMMGNYTDRSIVSISQLWSRYSKELGMTKSQFGMLQHGEVSTLSETEYNYYVAVWHAQ